MIDVLLYMRLFFVVSSVKGILWNLWYQSFPSLQPPGKLVCEIFPHDFFRKGKSGSNPKL